MKYRNFHEYMDAKGKMKAPITNDKTGDHVEKCSKGCDGAKKNAPKGPKVSEDWTSKGDKKLVKDGGKSKAKGPKVGEDWTSKGDKKLVIKFNKDGGTQMGKAAKIPTAESFAQYELLPVIRESIENNPMLTEDVVFELKRNGLLGLLVGEMLQHNETYRHLAAVMAHDEYGPGVCRKLVRAMCEEAAPPFAATLDGKDTGEDDEEEKVINKDTEDGEGIDDDEDLDGEDPTVNVDDDEESVPANNPPGAMNPMPNPGGPAMQNFQRAMMGRV